MWTPVWASCSHPAAEWCPLRVPAPTSPMDSPACLPVIQEHLQRPQLAFHRHLSPNLERLALVTIRRYRLSHRSIISTSSSSQTGTHRVLCTHLHMLVCFDFSLRWSLASQFSNRLLGRFGRLVVHDQGTFPTQGMRLPVILLYQVCTPVYVAYPSFRLISLHFSASFDYLAILRSLASGLPLLSGIQTATEHLVSPCSGANRPWEDGFVRMALWG